METAENTSDLFIPEPWAAGAKAIILVDLDAFFASVEQLDHPEWRGKPVIVGGSPEHRGVVSTASYEARAYGVHSAMASATAEKLCPDAIWSRGNFARYKEVSGQVMDIIRSVTPFVEQVSIDEAFADITPSIGFEEHPVLAAARIQDRICDLGVTCSVGLATSKSLAKIASEVEKPRGMYVVYPGREEAFVDSLPIRAMSGIGRATEARLKQAGFETLGTVFRADETRLVQVLGKMGEMVYSRLHGRETVNPGTEPPKSVSREVTFPKDLTERGDIERETLTILAESCRRLRKTGLFANTLTVKVHYDVNGGKSAQVRLSRPSADEYCMKEEAVRLVNELMEGRSRVRLIGVGLSNLTEEGESGTQETLPEMDSAGAATKPTDELVRAADRINARFGAGSVQAGRTFYRNV